MSQYKNPPLVEAVCEFRFAQSTEWREDLIESFYSTLLENFPNKETRVLNNVHVQATQKRAEMQMQQKPLQVFWNKDKTMLVQVGHQYLSIHSLKPYPSWNKFSLIIQQVYSSLKNFMQIQKFDRIGFVYIDKIEIPEETLKLEEYFNFFPHIGPNLPESLSLFNMSCDIPFNGNRDICRVSLGSTIPEKEKSSAFLLTTDYFLIDSSQIQPEQVLEWISEAHEHISDLFKGIITGKLESIFNE